MVKILVYHGMHEQDANNLVQYLQINNWIDLNRLDQLFKRARDILAKKSEALDRLDRVI